MHENAIGSLMLKAAFDVHTELGPGLLESAHEHCLLYELTQTGLKVESHVALPVVYKGSKLDCGYGST